VRRALKHEEPNVGDKPGFFGDGDELAGRAVAAYRMAPAHQRLDPHDGTVDAADLRLVMDAEATLAHRDLELVLDREPLLHHLSRARREQGIVAAPPPLCLVHGDIGVHEERFVVAAVRWAERKAGARADNHTRAPDFIGLAHPLEELLGPGLHIRLRRLAANDREELVAADACEQRFRNAAVLALALEEAAEARGHFLEEIVAGVVAEGVVDALEPVQVHEQEDAAFILLEAGEQGGAVYPDLLAVREARHRIVEGELADAPEARA
jgi:hypothetical protein